MNRSEVTFEPIDISPVALTVPPVVVAPPLGNGPSSNEGDVAADVIYENHLAEVRLGLAGSLFLSLRAKHAPTAAHSLRVALGCSAWSFALQLDEHQRDELEVAALLARRRQDRRARRRSPQAGQAVAGRNRDHESASVRPAWTF